MSDAQPGLSSRPSPDDQSVRPSAWWIDLLLGLVVGLLGIAAAAAASSLLKLRANPVELVAEGIIKITPGPVADRLIEVFQTWDKPLLLIGTSAGLLGLSAWAVRLARRTSSDSWPLRAVAIYAVMAAIAAWAAIAQEGATISTVLPIVAGFLGWLAGLAAVRRAPAPHDAASRREFLTIAGGLVAVAAVVSVGGRVLGRARRTVEQARTRLAGQLRLSRGVVPADADFGIEGMTPWRVPNAEFYRIDTAIAVPTINPSEWRLRIHGLVDTPTTFTYQDLLDRELVEDWVTICCVSNQVGGDLIGNAFWSGVRVADLLAECGVQEEADAILQTSEDGWTCGTPIEAVTDDRNALLALAMNGEPLPIEHGFPVRMIVPGLYGFVSATKWLVDIEVSRFDQFEAYWTPRGWSEKGPVKTQSRIEVPRAGRAVAGDVVIAGTAWAPQLGIEKVEIRLNGDDWVAAELAGVPDVDTWVQWQATVTCEPGIHTVAVRATDKSGYTQTPVKSEVHPDGATGWHTIKFTAEGAS